MEIGNRTRTGATSNDAANLADRILTGEVEIAEIGLTTGALRRTANPANIVISRIEQALAGEEKYQQRCMQSVRGMPGRISLPLLRLLAHGRCDAAAWIIIAPHLDFINLSGPMGGRTVMSPDKGKMGEDGGIIDTCVFLGNGAYWEGHGRLDLNWLPETAVGASVGRPLSQLVSHPALDGIPMRITEIDSNGAEGHVICTDIRDWSMFRNSIALGELLPIHLHPVLSFEDKRRETA